MDINQISKSEEKDRMGKCKVVTKDNRSEFMARLRQDYNLPDDDPVVDAMLYAVTQSVNRGYCETESIREKYNDLICPWCARLHYSSDCQANYEKYQQELAEKSKSDI